jgi:hypothetical protein
MSRPERITAAVTVCAGYASDLVEAAKAVRRAVSLALSPGMLAALQTLRRLFRAEDLVASSGFFGKDRVPGPDLLGSRPLGRAT